MEYEHISELDRTLIQEEQNWDVHGIPEQFHQPHGHGQYIKCPCTPEMLELIRVRKEAHEDIIEYQCTCCENLITDVRERIIDESYMA